MPTNEWRKGGNPFGTKYKNEHRNRNGVRETVWVHNVPMDPQTSLKYADALIHLELPWHGPTPRPIECVRAHPGVSRFGNYCLLCFRGVGGAVTPSQDPLRPHGECRPAHLSRLQGSLGSRGGGGGKDRGRQHPLKGNQTCESATAISTQPCSITHFPTKKSATPWPHDSTACGQPLDENLHRPVNTAP